MDYGQRIRLLREELGLSQGQVASHLVMDRSSYARYELGQTQPNFERLERLSSLYNVTIHYIVTGKQYRYKQDETDKRLLQFVKENEWLNDLMRQEKDVIKAFRRLYLAFDKFND